MSWNLYNDGNNESFEVDIPEFQEEMLNYEIELEDDDAFVKIGTIIINNSSIDKWK